MVEGRGFLGGASYLLKMPLEANGDPDSWKNYTYVTGQGDDFVRCRVHGVLVRNAQNLQQEVHVTQKDYLELKPPFSPERFGMPATASTISLAELNQRLHDPQIATRRLAALALRRINNRNAVPLLKGALADPDDIVRKHAVWGIGELGSWDEIPTLRPLLKDRSERVRDFTAFAMATLLDPEGARLSMEALNDSTRPSLRRGHAARALGRSREPQYLPSLKVLAASHSLPADLQQRVNEAIHTLESP